MAKVKIKQFRNKAKEPIAGLTPEHAIYDKNGVRLDAKLNNWDLSKIREAQTQSVNAVRDAAKEYDHQTIINNGTINNAADEEDITVRDNVLSLKDRIYTEGVGEMGYVILRKNKSFAEQVTKVNTIYDIRYEFELEDAEITIPEGCVLNFVGGKLSNGKIIGNNTKVEAYDKIIFNNVSISNCIADFPRAEWFSSNDTINECLLAFKKCVLYSKTYKCFKTINVFGAELTGDYHSGTILDFTECTEDYAVIQTGHKSSVNNIKIRTTSLVDNQIGLRIYYSTQYGKTENVYIEGFYHGCQINSAWYASVKNLTCVDINHVGYGLIIGNTEISEQGHGQEVNGINFDTVNIHGFIHSVVFANVGCHACVFTTPTFEVCTKTAIVQKDTVNRSQGNVVFTGAYFENCFTSKTAVNEDYECVKMQTTFVDFQLNFIGGRWANKQPSCAFGNKFNLWGNMSTSLGFKTSINNGEVFNLFEGSLNEPTCNLEDYATRNHTEKSLFYDSQVSVVKSNSYARIAELYSTNGNITNNAKIKVTVQVAQSNDVNYVRYYLSAANMTTGIFSYTREGNIIGKAYNENEVKAYINFAKIYENDQNKIVILLHNLNNYDLRILNAHVIIDSYFYVNNFNKIILNQNDDVNFSKLNISTLIPRKAEKSALPNLPALYKGEYVFDTYLNMPMYLCGNNEWKSIKDLSGSSTPISFSTSGISSITKFHIANIKYAHTTLLLNFGDSTHTYNRILVFLDRDTTVFGYRILKGNDEFKIGSVKFYKNGNDFYLATSLAGYNIYIEDLSNSCTLYAGKKFDGNCTELTIENANEYGTSEQRPILNLRRIGAQYFDTTLNKPIYWTGSKWVDATGADV